MMVVATLTRQVIGTATSLAEVMMGPPIAAGSRRREMVQTTTAINPVTGAMPMTGMNLPDALMQTAIGAMATTIVLGAIEIHMMRRAGGRPPTEVVLGTFWARMDPTDETGLTFRRVDEATIATVTDSVPVIVLMVKSRLVLARTPVIRLPLFGNSSTAM
jgi:hypothetical protein